MTAPERIAALDGQWLPVDGTRGLYFVSDMGQVYSKPRPRTSGGLMRQKLRNGYLSVSLCVDGRRLYEDVHRMVAGAFLGPIPSDLVVCHIDGDRMNNCVSNLKIATILENEQDKLRHGRRLIGERNHNAKLTWPTVHQIRRLGATTSVRRLAEDFGVAHSTIRLVLSNERWRSGA